MHELSLVQGILEAVLEQAEIYQIKKIEKVKIVVGEMTSVMPGALQFAFEVLREGTSAREAVLVIENRPIKLTCEECHLVFNPESLKYFCPQCISSRTDILEGRELFVEFFEGE